MAAVVIREFRPTDIPALNALHNDPLVAAQILQIPFTTDAERAQRLVQSLTQRTLVADLDGEPVGALGLELYTRRRAHVGSIGMAVRLDLHGQGIGRQLLAAAVDLADNWYNLRRIELEVYADNERAIRLYRSFGFEIEGTHRAYAFRLGEFTDALSMARLRGIATGSD
ncbi:MAG: GNAT family N-acetyltransferase [Thermomicrobiales bacterium]|nr:GNAT family N-acetyltransferase [Thermomicrobiales bacterium]